MRPLLGIVTALLVGGLVAAVGGCVEMLVLHEFRGIVSGILGTLGLGVAVGWTTGWGARLWHLRDARVVLALGALTGIVAEVATFWTLAHLLHYGEEGRIVPVLVPLGELSTREAIEVLGRAIDEGAWHWTRHWHVKGAALIAVWVVEAICILGLSAAFALVAVVARPYCEACRQWMRGPSRVGPLGFEDGEAPDEELAPDEMLRLLRQNPPAGSISFDVHLWHCPRCDHAAASVRRARPASDRSWLVEHAPITRETFDRLFLDQQPTLIAGQPIPTGLRERGSLPLARIPDQDSRWVRPCSSCGRRLATGFWEHLNGFAVECPHCGERHSHPGEIVFLLAWTAIVGPLAFFLSMRPLRAALAVAVVVALFLTGRSWFATHPSFWLEVTYYVVLLLGTVLFNAYAYVKLHDGEV